MSVSNVIDVRNKLLNLYAGNGELQLTDECRIVFSGIIVGFEFHFKDVGKTSTYWLQIRKNELPHFHRLETTDMTLIKEWLPLSSPPGKLIKRLHQNFPFKPTDRYLSNNGNFVA